MSDRLSITAATDADLDDITALEQRAFPSPWRREFFIGELHSPHRFLRVARDGTGELAGYLFAMWLFEEMHINKIAVAERWRRRGVATKLMDEAVVLARNEAVTLVVLEVRESNADAQEFYRRLGFTSVYRRPHYYPDGEAAIVMELRLE